MDEDARTAGMPVATTVGARTYVGVPVIRNDGSFFGTLCGVDPLPQEVSASGVQLLSVLARLCAFHLERDELLAAQTQARAQLEEMTGELQRRSEFEQQLIGIVSHDLKNPLTGIITSASLLVQQRGLDDAARRSAGRLLSSARRAARMVHDLLDFTEARHDRIRIQPRASDLRDLLEHAVEEVQMAHPNAAIRLECAPKLSGRWDPDRLIQAFVNLVENAVTYGLKTTPVSVRAESDDEEVVVSIHNEGEHIPEAVLDRIFLPLVRNKVGVGTRSIGLGLFIVRSLVEAHGGTVTVRSSAADGTTFTARLPRSTDEAAVAEPRSHTAVEEPRARAPLRIDALASDSEERLAAVSSPSLLSRDPDATLQRIVEAAATRAGAPAATVNLILDRTQLVRAHFGLAPQLQQSRAIDRSASFCQFVVKSREPFEVHDAWVDARVPQDVVDRLGVRAYYGVPVYVGRHVAGALCVFDGRPRTFTPEEKRQVDALAWEASERLGALCADMTAADALGEVTVPAFSELRNLLTPLGLQLRRARRAMAQLKPLIQVTAGAERTSSAGTAVSLLSDTRRCVDDAERALEGLETVSRRMQANVLGLEHVLAPRPHMTPEELVDSIASLTAHNTRVTGGLLLPSSLPAVLIADPRRAITEASTLVIALSDRLSARRLDSPIHLALTSLSGGVRVSCGASALSNAELEHIRDALSRKLVTTVSLEAELLSVTLPAAPPTGVART